METIYRIGIVIGIIVLYSIATWGISCIINGARQEDDDEMYMIGAWIIGMLAFVGLAIFTLEKFGLWGK